jgi:hypothetical protein
MSTYPINTTVPDGSHNPSQDYSAMQVNYSNINSWGGIDHVIYGATNAGQHLQVTIPTPLSASPTLTGTQGMFYTLSNGGVANAYFANADGATLLAGSASATSPGYVMLVSGVILQWGTITFSNASSVPVSFAIPFPTTVFNISITNKDSNSTSKQVYPSTSGSNPFSGFTANSNSGTITSANYYYFAIGN